MGVGTVCGKMGVDWCKCLRRSRVWGGERLDELYQGEVSNSLGRDGGGNLYRYWFTIINNATFVFVGISRKGIAMGTS